MRGGGTPEGGSMKFCTFAESLDVIKCANFHVYLMINLRARWGQKWAFPFEMHMALTTLPCATALASDTCNVTKRTLALAVYNEIVHARCWSNVHDSSIATDLLDHPVHMNFLQHWITVIESTLAWFKSCFSYTPTLTVSSQQQFQLCTIKSFLSLFYSGMMCGYE
jgi:hypothetical protein